MKPCDAPPLVIPRSRAVHALVVSLSYQVRHELHEFVRGDLHVREHVAETLLDLGHGTLRKRRETYSCRYHPRREGNRYWYSLYELADAMLDGKS